MAQAQLNMCILLSLVSIENKISLSVSGKEIGSYQNHLERRVVSFVFWLNICQKFYMQ